MSYTSIMVGVDPGADTPGRVKLAAQVASRFDALLIGVAAQEPAYPRGYGETVMPAGYGIEEVRQAALEQAGWRRADLPPGGRPEQPHRMAVRHRGSGPSTWRSSHAPPTWWSWDGREARAVTTAPCRRALATP